jgi:hypothetical protein
MILVRDVFQAKYGKGDQLATLFQEARDRWPGEYAGRILTDASGTFFTVVAETEVNSLAEWERLSPEIFNNPTFGEWFSRMEALVSSGRREFYNIRA